MKISSKFQDRKSGAIVHAFRLVSARSTDEVGRILRITERIFGVGILFEYPEWFERKYFIWENKKGDTITYIIDEEKSEECLIEADHGDWVIRERNGNLYALSHSDFKKKFRWCGRDNWG